MNTIMILRDRKMTIAVMNGQVISFPKVQPRTSLMSKHEHKALITLATIFIYILNTRFQFKTFFWTYAQFVFL